MSKSRKPVDRVAKRISADLDVIGVYFLAIVSIG